MAPIQKEKIDSQRAVTVAMKHIGRFHSPGPQPWEPIGTKKKNCLCKKEFNSKGLSLVHQPGLRILAFIFGTPLWTPLSHVEHSIVSSRM